MTDAVLNVIGIKVDPKQAEQGSKRVKKSLDDVNQSAISVKKVLATAFAAVSVSSAIREFAAYDQQLRNVATVANATESELAKLNDTALDLALGTRFNPQEVAQGMYSLASAGQSVNQQIATLPNVLDLAEAAQAQLGQTTELVVSTMAQFQIQADDSQRVVDTFTASIANSATNVPRLQVAMANSGSTANAMNQEFESSVAVLSILTTAFGNGEKAGTGYKTLLNQLATNGEKLGLSVSDAAGNMKPLVEILGEIQDAGIPATDLMKTFGTEAGPALAVLLEQGTGAIDQMRDSLLSNGQASETAAGQLDTLQGDWDQLLSKMSVLSIEAVDTIEPALRLLLQSLNALLTPIVTIVETLNTGVKFAFGEAASEISVFGQSIDQVREGTDKLVESMKNLEASKIKEELRKVREEYLNLSEETTKMEAALGTGALNEFFSAASTVGVERRKDALLGLEERIDSLKLAYQEATKAEEQLASDATATGSGLNKEQTNSIKEFIEATKEKNELLQAQIEVLNGNKDAVSELNEQRALANTQTQEERDLISELFEQQRNLNDELERGEQARTQLNNAQEVFNRLMTDAESRGNKYFKIEQKLNKERALLKKSLDSGGISFDQYVKAMGEAAKQANESSEALADLGDAADEIDFDGMFDGFAAGLNPAIGALQSFRDELELIDQMDFSPGEKEFYKTGLAAEFALNSMAQMAQDGSEAQRKLQAAAAVTNGILAVKAILTQGEGDPYTAFGRMAAMAATVASLGVQVSGAFGGAGSGGAEAQQARQGTGTVLGDSSAKSESIANALDLIASTNEKIVGINSGMLRSLNAMNNAIVGTATQIAQVGGIGDLGTRASGAFGSTGFIDSIVFGGSKVTDRGIQVLSGSITDAINGDIFQAYEVAKRKGLFGTRRRTNTAALEDGITNQIGLIIQSMSDAVLSGAEALGLNSQEIQSALDSYRIEEQRISLKDLTPEEQQAELQAVFSSMFDGLTEFAIPFITQFQQAGEGLGETLSRVSTTVLVFEEAIQSMGLDFIAKQVDPELFAQAAVSISEFAGGMDAFIDGYSTYIDKFLSEQEQFDILSQRLGGVFADLGLSIPDTRDGFKELIQGLDLTTASGQEAFGTLIALSGQVDSYYASLEDLTSTALADAVEALSGISDELAESQMGLFEQLQNNWSATNDLISAYDGSIEAEQTIADSLRSRYEMELSFIDQIRSASESITNMIAGTRESIELSLLDDEGQYNYFKERAESLADSLSTMTDPAQIEATISQINSYANRAYGLLDDDQRESMAPEFLQFLDDIGLTAATRLGSLEDEATNQTEQILSRIEEMQAANAEAEAQNQQQFGNNVQIMQQSVEMMQAVVAQMGQIRFPVDVYYRDDHAVSNL